ncbi:hypothetical protein [Aminobacter niigataensis]|uniref:hypothetical protein n=1 Tax=Aminobacter niigataensis TaxID=83265 RepID=UPI0024C65C80|nr:hypothetical protein [Aminobacter niigataensis]CAI2936119.1 protein of unknown function [Aminobacter niigataensis]
MPKTPTPPQLAKSAKPAINKEIADLIKARDEYRAWFHQERSEVARLKRRLDASEASLSAIRTVADAVLTANDRDDAIPF